MNLATPAAVCNIFWCCKLNYFVPSFKVKQYRYELQLNNCYDTVICLNTDGILKRHTILFCPSSSFSTPRTIKVGIAYFYLKYIICPFLQVYQSVAGRRSREGKKSGIYPCFFIRNFILANGSVYFVRTWPLS